MLSSPNHHPADTLVKTSPLGGILKKKKVQMSHVANVLFADYFEGSSCDYEI